MSIAVLIDRLLTKRPMTSPQIAAELGLQTDTVRMAMTRLRRTKRAYIAAWTERGPGRPIPIWQMGDKRDARQPQRETVQQRNKRKWRELKADPSKYVDTQIRKRVEAIRRQQSQSVATARPAPSPFAALFQVAA